MFTVTPLFPVSIMSHKMETLEELVMMMKLLQELTDPDGRGGGLLMNLGRATTMVRPLLASLPGFPSAPSTGWRRGGALCGPSAHYTPSSSTGLFFPRRAGAARNRNQASGRAPRGGVGKGWGALAAFHWLSWGGKNRKKEQRRWRWRREVGGGGGQQ